MLLISKPVLLPKMSAVLSSLALRPSPELMCAQNGKSELPEGLAVVALTRS